MDPGLHLHILVSPLKLGKWSADIAHKWAVCIKCSDLVMRGGKPQTQNSLKTTPILKQTDHRLPIKSNHYNRT